MPARTRPRGEVFAYTDSRLHGRSGLALLPGRHAAQRRLRGRRRAEYFAAGGELDPGRGLRRAGRTEPRAAHRCGGRAHSRLQHGLSPLGFRERGRLRYRVSQGRRRRGFLLAPADERRRHRLLARARSSGTTGASRSRRFASSRKATARRNRCCASSTSSFSGRPARRNGKGRSTARRASRGCSTSRSFTTASSATGFSSRSIPRRKARSRRI